VAGKPGLDETEEGHERAFGKVGLKKPKRKPPRKKCGTTGGYKMSFAARAGGLVNRVIRPLGIKVSEIERYRDSRCDELCERVRDFTQTSRERVSILCDAIEHVVRNNIKGDFVECGVWRGGSAMAAALTLLDLKEIRDIHLFDTFAGMPPNNQ
jgi:Macrocin-O-methyltransferase (TylF)